MPDYEMDPLIDAIVREMRRPVRLGLGLERRVLAALSAGSHGGLSGAWLWVRRPRTLRVSPLAGLAVAAGILALVAAGSIAGWDRTHRSAAPSAMAGSIPAPIVRHQFVLIAPQAATVSVVGDFNDWDVRATPLHADGTQGVWSVTVPLSRGRYHYTFVIDGTRWVPDPSAPRAVSDDFGRPNSVITVAGSST